MPKLLFDLYGVLLRPATPEAHVELERFLAPANPEAFWEAYTISGPITMPEFLAIATTGTR